MKVNNTLLVLILALVLMVADNEYKLGIAAFLGNYLVILLVVAILLGALGVKTGV